MRPGGGGRPGPVLVCDTPQPPPLRVLTDSWGGCRIRTSCSRPPRGMRREERVTVQGPVKKQRPDGMSHTGGRSGRKDESLE